MKELNEILREATAGIEADYYRLSIDGGPSIYRERVYCYELYHQMRLRWPARCKFRINGEIDKRSHPYFVNDASGPKPDLLVHVPGSGDNHAIIEVKSREAGGDGIRKDLRV